MLAYCLGCQWSLVTSEGTFGTAALVGVDLSNVLRPTFREQAEDVGLGD